MVAACARGVNSPRFIAGDALAGNALTVNIYEHRFWVAPGPCGDSRLARARGMIGRRREQDERNRKGVIVSLSYRRGVIRWL